MKNLSTHTYQSSGGFVIHNGHMLLVRKTQAAEVRMPKGHIEDGEDRAEAAMREVREETGYARLTILSDLGTLRAEFERENLWIVRHESAFLMQLVDETQVVRDAKDSARFEPIWVPLATAPSLLTFTTEREFARRALAWLNRTKD